MPTYDVSVSIRDAFSGKTTRNYQVDALDYPTALSNAAAMVASLEAYIGAGVLKYSVSTVTFENETPAAGSNIDEGASFQMDLGSGKTATLKIPSPDTSSVNADRSIDLTDALVSALLAHWENGPFLISDGETAVGTLGGKLDR